MTSTPTRPRDNVVITTKGPQDRNNLLLDGRTMENKGKLIPKESIKLKFKRDKRKRMTQETSDKCLMPECTILHKP